MGLMSPNVGRDSGVPTDTSPEPDLRTKENRASWQITSEAAKKGESVAIN